MRFAYGRDITPKDFSEVAYDRIFIDSGNGIEGFDDMVRFHLRRGWSDVITIINRHDIPWKQRNRIEDHFGATVEVHKKEPKT